MQEVRLVAEHRLEAGKSPARRLRRNGMVPAVVYGLGTDTRSVAVPARALQHILGGPGGVNTLIDLEVDGEVLLTLAREIQRHPVRGTLLHVDFVQVNRDTAVIAEVPVVAEGEPVGVRAGGRLHQVLFTITVSAKPGAIPPTFTLDVTHLDLGDAIRVGEIPRPSGVDLVTDPDEIAVTIAATRLGAARALEEGEEGEEGGEGEAASGGDES